jgi:hypothetical protein
LRDHHLFGGALDVEDGRVQLVAGCRAPPVGLTELLRRRASSGLMRIMRRAFPGVLTCQSHIESGLRAWTAATSSDNPMLSRPAISKAGRLVMAASFREPSRAGR